jgi:hypothetical protein
MTEIASDVKPAERYVMPVVPGWERGRRDLRHLSTERDEDALPEWPLRDARVACSWRA